MLATFRARGGVAMGDEGQFLVYGTCGFGERRNLARRRVQRTVTFVRKGVDDVHTLKAKFNLRLTD